MDDNTMRNNREHKRRNWSARLDAMTQVSVALVFFISLGALLAQWQGFWPLKMEMPWTTMTDFVEDRDGNVYVVLAIGRVLQYGPDGKFMRGMPFQSTPGRAKYCLATDTMGRVYMLEADTSYSTLFTIAGRPDVSSHVRGPDEGPYVRAEPPHVWRLDSQGQPAKSESLLGGEKAANRTVQPGELLFSGCSGRYRRFERLDGGTIDWYATFWETYLEICDGTRKCRRISVPEYLKWFRFPIPVLFLIGMIFPYVVLRYKIQQLWRRYSTKN